MNNKSNSPFTPGNPVPIELFVGRQDQIKKVLQYIGQITYGKPENAFLTGDRGIGKSSLASFLKHFVTNQKNILGIHIFLGGVNTLEEMVRKIFDEILKETKNQTWFNNINALFGEFIKEIGLFGVSVNFKPPVKDLRELVRNFPEAINNLLEKIHEEKSGLFIALDDVNGLIEKEEFANWYKSFADEVATHYKHFPVYVMLIGLPEKRDTLSKLQPSLMRIFRPIEIEKLTDKEVKQFFEKAFKNSKIKVEPSAMELMVKYSSGLPIMMHEIGDATFWADEDSIIDENDALKGLINAARMVGNKYLDPKVYRAIRSKHYRSILRKFGKEQITRSFKKSEFEANLNKDEQKVFHNFIRKIKDLGVIEADIERGRGTYKFVNEIFPLYIWLESEGLEKRRIKMKE